jgi:hypothetical protein
LVVARKQIPVALFNENRPAVLVASHERSGTHFLMNSLEAAYGYVASPWLDFDTPPLEINFYHPPSVAGLLQKYAAQPVRTIVKSHHPFEFFAAAFNPVPERWVVFYVHRHPVDVMISFHRVIGHWQWHEGPRRPTAFQFAIAPPEGRMMRYQTTQHATLLHRWAAHVESWLRPAQSDSRVILVPYDELSRRYESTVRSFSGALGVAAPQNLVPPRRDENVIVPRSRSDVPFDEESRNALQEEAVRLVGATMRKLGYA